MTSESKSRLNVGLLPSQELPLEAWQQEIDHLQEASFIHKKRQQALKEIPQLRGPEIPKISYENWPLLPECFVYEEEEGKDLEVSFDKSSSLVQVGNQTIYRSLLEKYQEKGVICTDIFSAIQHYPELIEKYYFQTAAQTDDNYGMAYNALAMMNGIFIYVPRQVVIDKPLESLIYQEAQVPNQAFIHHVLIVVEDNARLNYIERYRTYGSCKSTANIVVEIIAKSGAFVHYTGIDRLGKETTAYIGRRGEVAKDAEVDFTVACLNEGNVLYDSEIKLKGSGALGEYRAVAVTGEDKVQGLNSVVKNYGKSTRGNIIQKGVILNQSTLILNGVGHILKGAKGSDAQQEDRVLMFSDRARGDANPILLIDDNDVTAGHAASVGRVNPEQMYYLMSRGIDVNQARLLVIRGFLGEVIIEGLDKTTQEEILNIIDRRLIQFE